MIYFLPTFMIILLMAGGISKLLDILLHEHTKDEIRIKLEDIWLKYADSPPIIIVQLPLHLLNLVFDILFGERYFSKRALFRSALLSIAILISSLIVTGWITNTVMGMDHPPWKYFDLAMETERKVFDTSLIDIDKPNDSEHAKFHSKQQKEHIAKRWQIISKFNTNTWRISYSIIFVVSLLILNAFIDSISLAITRQMLKEIVETQSIFLISTILITNLFIATFLGGLILFLTMFVCFPTISLYSVQIIPYLLINYTAWTSIGLYAAFIVGLKLTGPWFKVVLLTTILPSILLCLILLLSIILYPLRIKIYRLVDFILIRAVDYPKGIFAFLTILLTTLGGIMGLIIKILG